MPSDRRLANSASCAILSSVVVAFPWSVEGWQNPQPFKSQVPKPKAQSPQTHEQLDSALTEARQTSGIVAGTSALAIGASMGGDPGQPRSEGTGFRLKEESGALNYKEFEGSSRCEWEV